MWKYLCGDFAELVIMYFDGVASGMICAYSLCSRLVYYWSIIIGFNKNFSIAIRMSKYIFTLEMIVTLVTVKTVVCPCALQRILDHTLGAIKLTKIHQNNAFSSNAEPICFKIYTWNSKFNNRTRNGFFQRINLLYMFNLYNLLFCQGYWRA